MCSPGESETSFTGKLMASLTICHNNSSGTSGVAKGVATRKQTSVNGSARNSSNSSGERRAISAGTYKPPSGASPRNTAPRNEVSGAFPPVLRYLISNRRCDLGEDPAEIVAATSQEMPQPSAAIRAAPPPAKWRAQSPHNSAAAQSSDADSTAPQFRAESLPPWPEMPRATTPASDRSNISRSTIAAPPPKPPDKPPSSTFASDVTDDSPRRSRCRWYRAPTTATGYAPTLREFHPAPQPLPPNTVLPFPHTPANPASP